MKEVLEGADLKREDKTAGPVDRKMKKLKGKENVAQKGKISSHVKKFKFEDS